MLNCLNKNLKLKTNVNIVRRGRKKTRLYGSKNWDLLEANAELREQNMQACAQKLTTFKDGKYSDEIRTCIMDLLAHNVSINQIEPVIRAVLKLSGVKCDRLPKHTVINDM